MTRGGPEYATALGEDARLLRQGIHPPGKQVAIVHNELGPRVEVTDLVQTSRVTEVDVQEPLGAARISRDAACEDEGREADDWVCSGWGQPALSYAGAWSGSR